MKKLIAFLLLINLTVSLCAMRNDNQLFADLYNNAKVIYQKRMGTKENKHTHEFIKITFTQDREQPTCINPTTRDRKIKLGKFSKLVQSVLIKNYNKYNIATNTYFYDSSEDDEIIDVTDYLEIDSNEKFDLAHYQEVICDYCLQSIDDCNWCPICNVCLTTDEESCSCSHSEPSHEGSSEQEFRQKYVLVYENFTIIATHLQTGELIPVTQWASKEALRNRN